MLETRDRIERSLEEVGVYAVVEIDGRTVVLSGLIESEKDRETAAQVIADVAPDFDLEDNLELQMSLPEPIEGDALAGDDVMAGAEAGLIEDEEALEPGDFTDQRVLEDPYTASGPSGMAGDEEIGEGEAVYIPPTDPVSDENGNPIGGFSTTSLDSLAVPRSALDGEIGDEALAEAVRRELREDGATSGLDIRVHVTEGIVFLHGTVMDIEDAESAEEVASRLPGVVEVREELKVTNV